MSAINANGNVLYNPEEYSKRNNGSTKQELNSTEDFYNNVIHSTWCNEKLDWGIYKSHKRVYNIRLESNIGNANRLLGK